MTGQRTLAIRIAATTLERRRSPEDLGDEILDFYTPPARVKNPVDFRWQIFSLFFPKKIRLKICHPRSFRKLHHILHSKEINLSPGTRSGGDFA